jgi:hypothetical protein
MGCRGVLMPVGAARVVRELARAVSMAAMCAHGRTATSVGRPFATVTDLEPDVVDKPVLHTIPDRLIQATPFSLREPCFPMDADPFRNFGEQLRAEELLKEHRATLVAEALDVLHASPGAEIVGLILDADASEASAIRKAIEQATGQDLSGRGFLGITPRQFVVQILRANAPDTLEWLPASNSGTARVLPLVAITKGGVQCAAADYPDQ